MPAASEAASTSASRRRPTVRSSTRASSAAASVLVDHHAPDVLAVEHVLEALVDLVQGVRLADQLVDLELARAVEVEEVRDVVHGVARAEQRALELLLVERQDAARELDGQLVRVREAGDDDGPALADRVEGLRDDLLVDD